MPRPAAFLTVLLLGVLVAFSAGCGQDDSGLISSSRADSLRDDLERIDEAVSAGRCDRAQAALDDLDGHVDGLPADTDRDLRERLRDGVERLTEQVPDDCADNEPEETVPEETVPEETVPEETVPEETVPEETQPEETVPEETVPEETVPEEPQPEVPQDPGGTQAPGGAGFVPPGQAKKAGRDR